MTKKKEEAQEQTSLLDLLDKKQDSRQGKSKEKEPEKEKAKEKEKKIEKPKKDLNVKEVREALLGGAAKPNHRGRGRTPAEKKEAYAKYNSIKRQVVELERNNKHYLILFKASDYDVNKKKFYNMGGHSAIIYCHEIAGRIKRSPVLRRDMDNGNSNEKFRTGVCSIQGLEALEDLLARIGIKREVRPEYAELVFFRLGRDYEKSEIREMLKQEQKRLDALNKLIYSKVMYPDIHRQILTLKRMIPAKVKNMDKTYREIVGMRMIDSLMRLVQTYSQMAHDDIDVKEAGKIMTLELDALLAQVSMMNELGLWEVSTCMRMGDVMIGAKKLIKGKILNK